MFKSKIKHEMKIHDHGLSPLLMENSFFKTHAAIKMFSVDNFS